MTSFQSEILEIYEAEGVSLQDWDFVSRLLVTSTSLWGAGHIDCAGTAVTHSRVQSLASCRALSPSYLSGLSASSSLRTFGVYIECKDATDAEFFALVLAESALEQEAHAFGPFMRKASQKRVVCSR